MGIIAIVLLSLIKNISVIFVITIKDAYIKFRTWFHKKINHKERRQRRLKEEAQKHAEKEQKEKEDRDLLKYGKIMHTTNVQAFNSNDVIAKTSTPRSTSNERLNNLVKDIKGIKKSKMNLTIKVSNIYLEWNKDVICTIIFNYLFKIL